MLGTIIKLREIINHNCFQYIEKLLSVKNYLCKLDIANLGVIEMFFG